MISDKSKKWIEVGKIIAVNPKMEIKCPECEKSFLEIRDIKNEHNPNELERIMYCKTCGARNVLRLSSPQ